jgi:hypothetical protein
MKEMLRECITCKLKTDTSYNNILLAYAAAYISLTHEGNFIIATKEITSTKNFENLANFFEKICLKPASVNNTNIS